MANVIERLERLAADSHVKHPNVWQGFLLDTQNGWTRDYVVAALNALSDLLKAATLLMAEGCEESGNAVERCWDQPGAGAESGTIGSTGWPRSEWCARCRVLEPLLREESGS